MKLWEAQPDSDPGPALLVEWEPPFRSFVQAIRPALARSPRPLGPEHRYRGVPGRAISASMLWHAAVILILLAVPAGYVRIARPLSPPPPKEYTLTYLGPATLPSMDDVSGAESGREGKSGGKTAAAPVQTVRISLAKPQLAMVYQPPKIALPQSKDSLANLLVVRTPSVVPAAPDASQMRRPSAPPAPAFAVAPVPPPPEVNVANSHPKLELPVAEVVHPPVDVGALAHARMPAIPGAAPAPPAAGGSGPVSPDSGVLISASPGTSIGAPDAAVPGTLVMGPGGSGSIGAGGSGGGDGIGHGSGPGSGARGSGPGSGATGTGYGDSTTAVGGISPGSGPGGTGTGTGTSPIRGLTISGGPTYEAGVVYLPSFGAPDAGEASPTRPLGPRRRPDITVIATSRSGGALPVHGLLEGPRIYTIYLQTRIGRAVLEFAELHHRGYDDDLTAPDPLVIEMPALPRARTILTCVIDRNGAVRDPKLVEAANPSIARRIIAALQRWRFRPVLRRETAIDVAAVLAFEVDVR